LPYINNILINITNPIINNNSDEECCVCYEINNNFVKLLCTHSICTKCSNKISNNDKIICPICRNEQQYKKIISYDEHNKIIQYFKDNIDEYKLNDNRFIPFDSIIQDVHSKINK